jgi:hypothetical protein
MSPSQAIRSALSKCEAASVGAALDDGLPEDLLSDPRMHLVRAIKAVDGFKLGPEVGGIVLIGDLQMRLNTLLADLDRCLPRSSVETTMAAARPVLAKIVTAIPQLIDDAKRLDAFASPLSMWG